MTEKEPKGVPPMKPKSEKLERLTRGQRADTGGDPYDRYRGQYSKQPKTDTFDGDIGGTF